MIYTVECSFSDPQHEADWNAFYSDEKLPALISVRGFRTSQRFILLSGSAPTYLAIHTVNDAYVLFSDDYREKGGGSFDRWQSMITDWRRNVYDGMDQAPSVGDRQILIVGDSVSGKSGEKHDFHLTAVALDRSPTTRWMDTMGRSSAEAAAGEGLVIYVPMGPQLVRPNFGVAN